MLFDSPLPAADPGDAAQAARRHVRSKQHEIVNELVTFLAIPNVSDDLPNIRKNARHLKELLEKRGIQGQILEMDIAPLVYGELNTPGASETVLFYCHYDGDPVDPSRWTVNQPFQPALLDRSLAEGGQPIPFPESGTSYQEDWRIYARSSSDDKSPIIALLVALDALRAARIEPTVNVKFLFEGEEEAGSPHLAEFLQKYRNLLEADLAVFADGPVFPTGDPTVYFGVRGIVSLALTLYGPIRPLHSGHYGNWAPNPAMLLSRLLSSMKGEDGRVLVDGFYDDVQPLSDLEKEALRQAPHIEEWLKTELGLAWSEVEGMRISEAVNLPSLNIQGLQSGWVGEQARSIIPSEATAHIDLRLVQGIEPQRQVQRVIDHIRRQGFHVVEDVPDQETRREHKKIARVVANKGYPALRTPMDLPVSSRVVRAVETAAGSVVKLPTMGGSVPLYLFPEHLGTPVIGLPTVNPDNNQHSPNENLRLGHFFRAIEIFAAVMAMQ